MVVILRGTVKPPNSNKSNSTYTYYKDGKPFQKRWYDKNGKMFKDKDYTDHGNSKKHPVTPHYHDYDSQGNHSKGYWLDKFGNKHFFED